MTGFKELRDAINVEEDPVKKEELKARLVHKRVI